jgi:hypothetical protein
MAYATLNKKASIYAWLHEQLQSDRVPLVSTELAEPGELAGLTDDVSYIVALDQLTEEQRPAFVNRCAVENGLTTNEAEALMEKIGGCPIPADAVTLTTQAGR